MGEEWKTVEDFQVDHGEEVDLEDVDEVVSEEDLEGKGNLKDTVEVTERKYLIDLYYFYYLRTVTV